MTEPLLPLACVSCRGQVAPLSPEEIAAFSPHAPDWQLDEAGLSITRAFACRDHKDAIAFIVAVAGIAEAQDHHPDHRLTRYKRLAFTLTTHAAKGLTVNDFVMAKLIDEAWAAR
ncbi:MAG TPA: 4a-hydroxytetrahydrobiopterin dehydratase [Candidatus Eisenbacteria bacterium]|nr:4a-hydroxytetrahydrobiopterin dehydratase [Candidatus Eisenbacteria bacterium]